MERMKRGGEDKPGIVTDDKKTNRGGGRRGREEAGRRQGGCKYVRLI